ncbi:hypothetical protein SEA_LONELYBOI_33 [Gordonia phage LonelyBoi]|nr:hypothetical protein SEA_LONELYBOI_33 [Gordonia phage LonelyBoi]
MAVRAARMRDELEAAMSETRRGRLVVRLSRLYARARSGMGTRQPI